MNKSAIQRAIKVAQPIYPEFRFKLTQFDKIELLTSCAYLVRGIIPREGIIVVWGPPKCGKSFWIFDLMMHVALGCDYRGHKVRRGNVVYIACEGERGLGARAAAFRQEHLDAYEGTIPFHLVTSRLDLAKDHERLISDIKSQIGETMPAAIIIDTLNRSIGGSENNPEDMTAYVKAADVVRERFACAVIVIHHCGTEGTRPRGHTSLTGAADAQIAITRNDVGIITARVEFMKDGLEGQVIASKLSPVVVGSDEQGDEISSCVIVATDMPLPKAKGKKPIPADYLRAHEFLTDAIAQSGRIVNAEGIPLGVCVVTIDECRETLKQHGMLDKNSSREWFRRMKRRLVAERMISIREPYVWCPPR